jgi:hypothetical protein
MPTPASNPRTKHHVQDLNVKPHQSPKSEALGDGHGHNVDAGGSYGLWGTGSASYHGELRTKMRGKAPTVSKSYSVGVLRGWVGAGYPLCRMSITSRAITLSSRLIPWVPRFEVAREEVTMVVLTRGFSGVAIATIDDEQHRLEGVRVQMPVGVVRVRRTLEALGYPVVAYDRLLKTRLPWLRSGWLPPPDRKSP